MSGPTPDPGTPHPRPGDEATNLGLAGMEAPGLLDRVWRGRTLARFRHRMGAMRRTTGVTTRAHAKLILLSGGKDGSPTASAAVGR